MSLSDCCDEQQHSQNTYDDIHTTKHINRVKLTETHTHIGDGIKKE